MEAEQDASRIWVLELEYIPGLLQTPEYLRAVQDAQPTLPPDHAEAVCLLRTRRQELLFGRSRPPRMVFLIGRSSLDYLNGLPEVRGGQLSRLRQIADLPGVEIRVIVGLHAAMAGSFNVLTPGTGPSFAYVDSIDGCRYIEDGAVVSLYERDI